MYCSQSRFSNTKQRVVACDPYLVSGAKPLDRFLPKAYLDLCVACARYEDPKIGLRNTCAGIFDWPHRHEIVRWVPAIPEGKPGWRYGVDYGVGCFMSEKLAAGLKGERYEKVTSYLTNRISRSRSPRSPSASGPTSLR